MSTKISINGEEREAQAATIAELLRVENVDPCARYLAVAVNGAVVPRSTWNDAEISPGDAIEIVRPAPGG